MSIKELIERRAKIVMEAKKLIDNADTEGRSDLNKVEGMQYDSILAEVESLSKEIDKEMIALGKFAEGRVDYSNPKNFEQLLEDLKKPTSYPIKPEGRYYEPEDTKLYNKNNLVELRSYIRSQGKLLSPNKELNAGKYFYGLISGDWRDAPNEFQLRALTTEAGSGGVFVPEEISSEIIFKALNKAQCVKAGISIVSMDSKTKVIPKQASEVETEWKKEGIQFSKSTNLTFVPLTLTCKTLMALIELSVELAEDSAGECGKAIEEAMAQALAVELDRAVLNGATNGITGIIATSGILAESYLSGALDYSTFSKAFYKLEAKNCNTNSMLIAPDMLGELDLLVDTLGQPITPPESWALFKKFSTNQLANYAILGDWSKVVLGIRSTMNANIMSIGRGNVESSRVANLAFEKLNIMIRAFLRADAQVKIPEHLCLIAPLAS